LPRQRISAETKKAKLKMKVAAKEETTVDLKTIYDRYLETLTDAKFLLNDISSVNVVA
jgi:hypothetical protein